MSGSLSPGALVSTAVWFCPIRADYTAGMQERYMKRS